MEKVYLYHDNCAAGEYGNDIMLRRAEAVATRYTQRPLVVSVYEHGGWFLQYLFGDPHLPDGTTVGTANDGACFDPKVRAWRECVRDASVSATPNGWTSDGRQSRLSR